MTTTAPSQPTSAPLRIPLSTFHLLGAELLEAADGRAKVRFVPGHATTNPAGLVQGGILAACLDDVMGPAVFSLRRERDGAEVARATATRPSAASGRVVKAIRYALLGGAWSTSGLQSRTASCVRP